jgi:uncharacterized protein YndB with AHSA1/START domain
VTGTRIATKPVSLEVRKFIPASPDRVFSAWTDPEELQKWWGPKGVRCQSAEIDLCVGGRYRIANELPDGSVLWIAGEFEVIERPRLLIYTWTVETSDPKKERVGVRFDKHEQGTSITITHEQISTLALRDQHQHGWNGCLDGLQRYLGELAAGS